MKRKGSLKRVLSLFLCAVFCLSLLPVTQASAFTTEPADLDSALVWSSTMNPSDVNWQGVIMQMMDVDGRDDLKKIVVSVYDIPAMQTASIRLQWDKAQVDLVNATNKTTVITAATAALAQASRAVEFAPLTAQVLQDGYNPEDFSGDGTSVPNIQEAEFVEALASGTTALYEEASESGKTYGKLSVDLTINPNLDSTAFKNVIGTGGEIKIAADAGRVELYTLYFKVKTADSKVTSDTFSLFAKGNVKYGADTYTTKRTTWGAYMVGFPEPPEPTRDVTFTVKTDGGAVLPGAVLTFAGNSTRGTDISGNYIAEASRTTGDDGTVTVALPDSNASKYRFWVANTSTSDGKTYAMNTSATSGVTFDVDATHTAAQYTDMKELEAAYPIRIKAYDKAGADLALTGATVSLGGKAATASEISGNTASFTVASTGSLPLVVSGITGYQDVTSGTASIGLAAKGNSLTEATLSLGDVTAAPATISIENDASGQYIKVVLRQKTTNVTIPVGVPDGITKEQAEGLTLTATPVDGSSNGLKAEVGDGGVKSGDVKVTAGGDGTVTGIEISANLPDGSYDVTIGGNGLESVKTTVTVQTTYDDDGNVTNRVVNIGGTPTLDTSSGAVTGVTGGVTGTTTGDNSGKVDLTGGNSGTTITEGGNLTVDPDTGGVTAGGDSKPVTGGLLGSDEATGGNLNMKPTVVTDALYDVDVTPMLQSGTTNRYNQFKVEVYLKNAKASSGTFGMYYDPALFDAATAASIKLENGVKFSDAMSTYSSGAISNPEVTSTYMTFAWYVGDNNTVSYLDARSERKLVATITLNVNAAKQFEDSIKETLDNRSVYVMDYTQTGNGGKIAAASGNEIAYNENMGSIWREVGKAGASGSIHVEDEAAKAIRGGFYQYYDTNDDAVDVAHDIRININFITDLLSLARADFWVMDSDTGAGVYHAKVDIYDAPYDPDGTQTPLIADLYTDNDGYAFASLDPDVTYYYVVTETSHWDYPDGTAATDKDGLDYDSFLLTANGASPNREVYLENGKRVTTPIVNGYVNVRMEPKTFHEVELKPATDGSTLLASISSVTTAYNYVTYYFTIAPDAGRDWNIGATYADMDAIAAAIEALLYDVDADGSDETAAFRTKLHGTDGKLTVQWDSKRDQFYIDGSVIEGLSIGTNTLGEDGLRAGDIVIKLPDDAIEYASYKITAVAGAGGQLKRDLDTTLSDGTTDATASDYAAGSLTETIADGRTTSAIYTFKADDGNKISSVVINGVAITLTEEQKKAEFAYQFKNVSEDRTIRVSFEDAETGEELSDPFITVEVGAKGEADVTATKGGAAVPVKPGNTDPNKDTLDGQATGTYEVDADTVTVLIRPDDGFEIDTVLVGGVPQNKDAAKETDPTDSKDYFTGDLPITIPNLEKGDTESVVVTFKPKGEDSTQAIVTAKIVGGFGKLTPVGIAIYPISSTPTYQMTPDEGWKIGTEDGDKSVVLDGVDKSKDVTKGTDNYSYTLPSLVGNVTLEVTFLEQTIRVAGQIRIVATGSTAAAAHLTFVRAADPATKTDETTIEFDSATTVISGGTDSSDGSTIRLLNFEHQIPAGEWTVTVYKQGYLKYEVTGFTVSENAQYDILFGDSTCNGGEAEGEGSEVKYIPLIPGDAYGEGNSVALNDASVVVAGWISGAAAANKVKGDIDENGNGLGSTTDDMSYVRQNMFQPRKSVTYTAFCA